MISRRKFFNKVFIASIIALQITASSPIYNVLAADSPTEEISGEYSISKNDEVDKKTKEAIKIANSIDNDSKDNLEKYYNNIKNKKEKLKLNKEKILQIKLDLESDKIIEEEKQVLRETLKKIKKNNKKLNSEIRTIEIKIYIAKSKEAHKIEEVQERNRQTLRERLKEIRENKGKYNRMIENIILTYGNYEVTPEEVKEIQEAKDDEEAEKKYQALQEKLLREKLKEMRKSNDNYMGKINTKVRTKICILEDEEAKEDEASNKIKEAKKAEIAKKVEEAKKIQEAKTAEIAKKVKEDKKALEKYYNDLKEKTENLRLNKEKLSKIKLYLKSDKLIEEERYALQEQLNNIKELNKKLDHDIITLETEIEIAHIVLKKPEETKNTSR